MEIRKSSFCLIPDPPPDCIVAGAGVYLKAMELLKIGETAKESGFSIDTIRFYEKKGLLKKPGRSRGGFRLFGSDEIETLRFIRRAQAAGFSLTEIREFLLLLRQPRCAHPGARRLLTEKIEKVRQKIRDLQALEQDLKAKLKDCTAKSGWTHTI